MTKANEPAPPGTNESAPGTEIGAKLTPLGSGFDLVSGLRKLRDKYGAESPVGHRCSNIEELLKQPIPPADLIRRQVADLEALLAAR